MTMFLHLQRRPARRGNTSPHLPCLTRQRSAPSPAPSDWAFACRCSFFLHSAAAVLSPRICSITLRSCDFWRLDSARKSPTSARGVAPQSEISRAHLTLRRRINPFRICHRRCKDFLKSSSNAWRIWPARRPIRCRTRRVCTLKNLARLEGPAVSAEVVLRPSPALLNLGAPILGFGPAS